MMRILQDLQLQPQHTISTALAFERLEPFLFDYFFRMTGVHDISQDHLAKIKVALVDDQTTTISSFVVLAFSKAHNFSLPDWSADTSELNNPAYNSEGPTFRDVLTLYSCIGGLAAEQRELVLLHDQLQFGTQDIATITKLSPLTIQALLGQARDTLSKQSKLPPLQVLQICRSIRLLPIGSDEPQEKTLALSQIIGGFDDANLSRSWRGPIYIVIVLLVIGLLSWFLIR